MIPKVRILDDGRGAWLELDGKTMGAGVDLIEYKKKGSDPAELTIHIQNTDDFQFHPDGDFDRAEKWLKEHEGYRKPLPLSPWDQSESAAPPIITAQEAESGQVRVRGEIDGKKIFDEMVQGKDVLGGTETILNGDMMVRITGDKIELTMKRDARIGDDYLALTVGLRKAQREVGRSVFST